MSPQEGFEHMKKLYAYRDQGRMVPMAVKEWLESLQDRKTYENLTKVNEKQAKTSKIRTKP